ncbi:hypothetical protein [Thermohalobacter berrensis]|uniref:Uncharacterized protein n=1 Tax=Thermohalobacter berrensis TaxID=99594 RepID=A0A419SXT9_9FIRM|nr:hypothetical protein [Thermohalobacter berrensis]RKD30067.1 hypothetical protein BET03_05015 [Thermohalobacter berrensis]
MNIKTIMFIALIFSGLEIFLNIFTMLIQKIASLFKKDYKLNQKGKDAIKLFVVAIFMISVIYFLIQLVKILAMWFGIPLDKSILDIFR